MSEPLLIRYRFTLADGSSETFEFQVEPGSMRLRTDTGTELPDWTRLEFQQCPNCPLSAAEHSHCPVATGFADIVKRFEAILSYDRVQVVVDTRQRRITGETSAEQGLSSLMGLVMATSACPHTDFFKPMARFHLPLADEEETTFRSVAIYLLAQHFRRREGQKVDVDLEDLKKIYEGIRLVNKSLARRLRAAGHADSTLNAVVLLDAYTIVVPAAIEDSLADLRGTLAAYMGFLDRSKPAAGRDV